MKIFSIHAFKLNFSLVMLYLYVSLNNFSTRALDACIFTNSIIGISERKK